MGRSGNVSRALSPVGASGLEPSRCYPRQAWSRHRSPLFNWRAAERLQQVSPSESISPPRWADTSFQQEAPCSDFVVTGGFFVFLLVLFDCGEELLCFTPFSRWSCAFVVTVGEDESLVRF